MKFRDRTTGQIYNNLFELQQKSPTVSFPTTWTTETYDYANVDLVIEVPEPQVSNQHNKMEYTGVQLINGQWTDTWSEVPKYSDPIEQAEWVASCTAGQWDVVRQHRDDMLKGTDYTQLSDTPITIACRSAFLAYRQALRDITLQTDPYNISWPIAPIYEKE